MRFLTDANVFVPMVDGLRILGHDVFDIKEQKLNDLYDSEIYDLAQRLNRIIVSMDKDFSSILLYPPGEHHGIIVAKLYRLSVTDATQIFIKSFKTLNFNDIKGNIVIIDKKKVRVRKEKL